MWNTVAIAQPFTVGDTSAFTYGRADSYSDTVAFTIDITDTVAITDANTFFDRSGHELRCDTGRQLCGRGQADPICRQRRNGPDLKYTGKSDRHT